MSADRRPSGDPVWFKSSYSGGNTTECVEAAQVPTGLLVRDSKKPEGRRLQLSAAAWSVFIGSLSDAVALKRP